MDNSYTRIWGLAVLWLIGGVVLCDELGARRNTHELKNSSDMRFDSGF